MEVEMDNAAFDGQPAAELSRILEEVAKSVRVEGACEMTLMDANGNKVGNFKVSGDR